jgi:MoaA/NifB/PqqE/SkfB family radical SAM enzyme
MIDLHAFFSLAGHFLAARFLGRKRPLMTGFKVTHRCNCRCVGCPFWRKPDGDIPFEQALSVLDGLQALGVKFVILEGGEPFLWRDGKHRLDDVVDAALQRFLRVGITTNGSFPLETKADIVWVSIDGFQETHDRLRGEGTFERALANIEASSHPHLYANITINGANADEIPELVRFLSERVRGITFQFYYPYPGTEDLWLEQDARRAVLDRLIGLKREGYLVLDSVAALEHLKENSWRCHPWLIASADPDGTITQGCYLLNRAEVACERCGFAAHVEMSLAYDLHPAAILTGMRIFGL